jgi:predicted O-linked N-acetylglucosamine transferase (SPINDLY family)
MTAALPNFPTLTVPELFSITDQVKQHTGNTEKSLLIYQVWIAHNGSHPLLHAVSYNYAAMLSESGQTEKAMEQYLLAINLNPLFLEARLNLGLAFERLGRIEDALSQWKQVLTITGEHTSDPKPTLRIFALKNLGRMLETHKRFAEAESYLYQALLIDPNQDDVIQHYMSLRQKQCKWPLFPEIPNATTALLRKYMSPLSLLALTNDPKEQLAASHLLLEKKFQVDMGVQLVSKGHDYSHTKIRIGYVSSDLCMHAVSLLTVQMFESWNRDLFEVYAFSWSKPDNSEIHKRVQTGVTEYISIHAMTDEQAANAIREREIDIVVDLHGVTSGARCNIFSYRPAPYSVTYLGFPGPVGHPQIDYVLADHYLITPEMEPYFVERPLRLPTIFQMSDDKRAVAAKPTRKQYGLPKNKVVYCSFSNNYKFTVEMFATWMRILKRVPGSVLWLLADNEWSKAEMLEFARLHHIEEDRLIFAPREMPDMYQARYQMADLFLDTFPFNAGTTANDALFMDLPILTQSGSTFASRMAGALLNALGFDELIVDNLADYEEKAVTLGLNRKQLLDYPAKIAHAKQTKGVFDSKKVLSEIEQAYLSLVKA